ncbi:MAG: LysR family transcriptional regulator [Betaproteobacteria bacterium]
MSTLNYKHLHHFWMVARTGGITRAAERLNLTAQTISGQIAAFEHVLGFLLFDRVGRHLELTDAGRVALGYADAIFSLGEELESEWRQTPHGRVSQVRAGIADVMPKSVAYGLLAPVLRESGAPRIVCREGKLASLLGDLAVHRLDIVLADRPMPANLAVRGYSHLLGECGITFLATPELVSAHDGAFPRNLDGAPLLLPGEDSDVRPRLLRWFDKLRIHPRIVGEFDDTALLTAFGQGGAGIFPVPTAIVRHVKRQGAVASVGRTRAVTVQFYAISTERHLKNPAVLAVTSTARRELFARRASRA